MHCVFIQVNRAPLSPRRPVDTSHSARYCRRVGTVTLPALIDVRDDLERVLAAVDEDDDLADETATVRDPLDAFEERDRADRGGIVDSDARAPDEPADDDVVPVGEVPIRVTVANTVADTEIVPVVTSYDEDADDIETVRGPEFALTGGEQEQFESGADALADATSYIVSISDPGTFASSRSQGFSHFRGCGSTIDGRRDRQSDDRRRRSRTASEDAARASGPRNSRRG